MKIQEAATKIISMWEHGGRYDSHGNGAYGLIGWQGGQLVKLLDAYTAAGGNLHETSEYYARTLEHQGTESELDAVAKLPMMQRVQQEQAQVYMTEAIQHQCKFYKFKTPLAQLVLCDMGVNNGIYHHYVEHCDAYGGAGQDEHGLILSAEDYRIKVAKDYGYWRLGGIRRRYQWYRSWLQQGPMDMSSRLPTLMVNGGSVTLDDRIEPLQV